MLYKKVNGWEKATIKEKKNIFDFSEEYKQFLDLAKTEREFVTEGIKIADKYGFKNAEEFKSLKAGDKVYYINRKKNLALVIVGKDDLTNGANFIVSHLDSPRLDLKQNPLYEDTDFAMMKTHYYGGIKKYQWASRALALHGVVALKDGTTVNIVIGEDPTDPVFTIPDLLPHLGKLQRDRKSADTLKGEELNILVGSIPSSIKDKKIKEKFKYAILEKLNKDYGITEEDFLSAELEIVPAEKARDIGFDRALIGAYGQDDRICAYTSLKAILDFKGVPEKTAVCFLVDKEEIGSAGSTGSRSNYIEYFMADLLYKTLNNSYNDYFLKKLLWNSHSLSSDVNAGLNPLFKSVHDSQNASRLGYGLILTKYTGSRGKSGSSDADAEYIAQLRNLFDKNLIKWQTGMLGKVDEGGGGTIALLLAEVGIRTIDAGAALLAMHSPMEVSSKFDVYELYKAYKVFYEFK